MVSLIVDVFVFTIFLYNIICTMKLIYILILFFYLNITSKLNYSLSDSYCDQFIFDLDGLPQVFVRPQTAVLPSSSEARLTCESSDTPFASVAYWTHVGQRIELNPSIIEMHDNELRIFQFGDTAYTQPGAYACVVSTRYGLLESEPSMLSLPSKFFMFILNIYLTNRQLVASLSRCVSVCTDTYVQMRPVTIAH
jgi:hypothetical protein